MKDLFHLQGLHTGCGNRAYRRLYPASDITSAVVQTAIDKGAIIVGKTKTAEFGGSQEVVGDWVDYSYPFNARGDGYLAATGSSTGSAASLAAYPWLDLTIGTDGAPCFSPHLTSPSADTARCVLAGGSIRDPAVAHGIFGFRPSHDGTATEDAVIPCPYVP